MANIILLAEIELSRERITIDNPDYADLLIERMKRIRHWLDMQVRNKKVLISRYEK
jgi:hypothetical protein